ncbi:glycosyltransferase family 87 protein [Microbacterium aureliae]
MWTAFGVVHAVLIGVEFAFGKAASWDVDQLYRWWAGTVVAGAGIPGITEDWVYPAFALVPMLLAQALAVVDYTLAWGLVVTAADAAVFAMLVGSARSRGRRAAAWFWLLAATALGGVGMFRLDALTVPLAIAGGLWAVRRPWAASVLLAAATWLKVWPAAVLGAAVIAARRRMPLLGGAAIFSAAVVIAVVALGGIAHVFSFVGDQTERGLQLEAPVSTVYLWGAVAGDPGAWVYYDAQMVTFQVTGPNVDVVIALMTPLMALAMAAIAGLGAAAAWRGATFVRLFPPLGLALVLAFIVFNKVGSPQYMAWLIAPVVIGLVLDRRRWRRTAVFLIGVLALTQLIFPWLYDALLQVSPGMVVVLTARNLALVALLALVIAHLVRVLRETRGRSRPAPVVPAPSEPAA